MFDSILETFQSPMLLRILAPYGWRVPSKRCHY